MNIIDNILNRPEFVSNPPVLVDIGASGKIHSKWKKIAKYSVCIAFDADDREFGYVENVAGGFKKLFIYNCIVSDKKSEKIKFYLTRSPYCSSTLEPDLTSLNDWSFADKFNVEKNINLNNITLSKVLENLKINNIDWFKTDSQGIDLRLFKSLSNAIQDSVIIAEFEPGFIDAYKSEDKLFDVVSYMSSGNFWLSDFVTKGSELLTRNDLSAITNNNFLKKLIQFSHRKSPGWAEITYINSFKNNPPIRNYLLGWVFSIIHQQYGFSLKLAREGMQKFNDKIFDDMKQYSVRKIRNDFFKLKFYKSILEKISKI
ncbi:MAG: FkbM family methyltransferase [Ignavibacteriaceae bacterium]|nr:FkbM family methyltransferase [Ignavibacteriaceae bacterium]